MPYTSNIRLPDDLADRVGEAAHDLHVSRNTIIIWALERFLTDAHAPTLSPAVDVNKPKRDFWDHAIGEDPDHRSEDEVEHQDEDPYAAAKAQVRQQPMKRSGS